MGESWSGGGNGWGGIQGEAGQREATASAQTPVNHPLRGPSSILQHPRGLGKLLQQYQGPENSGSFVASVFIPARTSQL